jgi:hypothetical protein
MVGVCNPKRLDNQRWSMKVVRREVSDVSIAPFPMLHHYCLRILMLSVLLLLLIRLVLGDSFRFMFSIFNPLYFMSRFWVL